MSSILGLPTRGTDVTVLITKVHLHPLCVLVEFWGNFGPERAADYECLAKDIQSPGNTFQELEGNPGDQCLVQIDDTWYRSRMVSRNGSKYSVFLIDKGITHSTTTRNLAWGKKKHFHLPPEVEFCVLANVLPVSPENRWSPVALSFLKSLSGKSVKAHVQDVLVPQRTFLLHIPCISKQMYEMGIAKKLSPDMFQDFFMSLQSRSEAELSPETHQISVGAGERLHKKELFMYPELAAGTVETVIVTDVTNPQRIFCQLKVFSQELKKLSEQMTQCCEGRMTNCIVGPEMIGYPCAARGSDGKWYRSVLQQIFPTNKVVEVLNVDYGMKQFVQVENVRPLAPEFFRMPVVTYICSLHGIIDKGVGWTTSQIDYLKSLLLYKTVIAKFEYQSISEGVYYVTLYGDDNTNISNLFGSKESCLLECDKTLGHYAICSTTHSHQHPTQQERKKQMLTPGQAVDEKERKGMVEKFPAEDLLLNSSHQAVVQHVSDPSVFWIQTKNYTKELDELMDNIYHLYQDSVNKDVLKNPTVGLYCAAKAEDGDFYRATVVEVGKTQIKVFFVDYGNTEVVDTSNIRTLPDDLKKLPRLALKCSLAGIRPKDGKWSQSACEFLISAVTDKVLNVHVTAKYDGGYVVQLTDPEAQEEKDLSTLMCSSGHAERTETRRQPEAKMTRQPAILPPTQLPDARLSGVYRSNGKFSQILTTVGPASNERRNPTFREHMFPIGSVLDVSVSYIESPNDFWCQLVQNAGHLKLLMHDIQAYYAGSEFQPLLETACVARHPDNGMWYRALVIHKHETPHVDALFVDYGQMETVSLYDLRRICPEFLNLYGQAFRCSLLNPVDPTSATNEWNEEARARFHSFVETAASNFVVLKCTIYAVMYSEQKIVFNIVDLETPFESVSTSMVSLTKNALPKKATGPSFRLDTYYYSTHNIKTGAEEKVTVTCVNNVSQFYCQLDRNADVIKDLKVKVSNLCHQLENVKLPTVFGTLCFAKYTDGQWYRGQIKATKPAILVHFVDYGDTIEVDKSDLLPVPREANDIMSVPVQAVVCGLSDVPADVPSEVNSWFETSATEGKFRALVVAREPDGKLLVELYHGNTQINSKIKKVFQIQMQTEKQVVYKGGRAPEASANHAQKIPKAAPQQAEMEHHAQTIKKNVSVPIPTRQTRDADMNVQSALKPSPHVCVNGQKVRASPLELYRPPHQRESSGMTPSSTGNSSELANVNPRKENFPTETKQLIKSRSVETKSAKVCRVEKLPKLADLPSKSISSGMEASVYVSHYNSPLSFYVQLVQEEDGIFSLVENLNDPQSIPKTGDIKDVHPGDLVQAEFADDSSWYRALVREIHSNMMVLVEFVDFGNTATMPISKIGRLHKSFLETPTYSIHCMLSDAAAFGKEEVLDPEVVSAFKEDIGCVGEKVFKCQFIRQSGSVWEVSLEDSGVTLMCKVPTRCSSDCSEIASGKLEQVKEQPAQNVDTRQVSDCSQKSQLNFCSLHYRQQELLEGLKLEVYITAINDAQTFWCQQAYSEELDKISSTVSEAGNAANDRHTDLSALSSGSPCIALFSDDHLWYRAEVVDKDGDELSVLFVDYGNKSQVSVTDVREMPPDLMEIPSQAFLCELEGFDASHGSWDSLVDELFLLTTDKVLQLTVTRVTREEGKIKCLVQMECEGLVINEALKTSTAENEPGAVGLTTSYETPPQCDSTVKETAPLKDQLEYPKSACSHPQRGHSEEQSAGELVDPHPGDEIPKLASSPKTSKSSEDSLQSESFAESPVEGGDQTESLRDTVSNEVVNMVPNMVVSETKPKDILPFDSGIDETMLPPFHNEGDQGILTSSCDSSVMETNKGPENDGASVIDTVGPGALNLPLDESATDAKDDSEVAMTNLESLSGEVNTYSMESGFAIMSLSDPTKERDDGEITTERDSCLTSTTTVKMLPREAVFPRQSIDLFETVDNIFKDSKQMQTEWTQSSFVLPAFDTPTEQDIESGDGFPKEEVPCVTTRVENALMTEEETLAHCSGAYSALLADTAATEPQTCTAPFQDSDECVEEATGSVEEAEEATSSVVEATSSVVEAEEATSSVVEAEEATSSVEEACLTDVCAVPNEPNDDDKVTSARDDGLSCMTAQETHYTATEDETSALHEDKLSALPSDTGPQTHTVPCPDLSKLVEEVTCLVRDICLMDVCKDSQQEAKTEDSEQLVHSSPKQKEDFRDGVLEEEMASSADDSFGEGPITGRNCIASFSKR